VRHNQFIDWISYEIIEKRIGWILVRGRDVERGNNALEGIRMTFHLTEEQTEQLSAWSKGRTGQGPVGGRITVSFTETAIGNVVKARDATTGDEIDLTEYENF